MTELRPPFLSIKSANSQQLRYEVVGILGAGSFGTVYEVRDRDLGRDIAIKVLDPHLVDDPQEQAAFLEEARSSAQLDHPGIVPVYDVGSAGGAWFAMKRIAGMTVEQALCENPRPPGLASAAAVAMIFMRVCDALGSAHAMGTVHRDVKPANLLLGQHGEVWVSDWGLASRSGSLQHGALVGTPLYMAPEQARGEAASPRWDIYAVGAVLHEVLYGVVPLVPGGDDWWERKKTGVRDLAQDALVAAIPAPLCSIIHRCLQVDPGERYADGSALAADLRAFISDGVVAAHRERLPARLLRTTRRHRWTVAVSAPIVLLCVVLGLALAQERFARWASWGSPVADLNSRGWVTAEGEFMVTPGEAISRSGQNNLRIFTKALEGGVAIEYEAYLDPTEPPGDVSLAIGRGLVRSADGAITGLFDPTYCMTGAWDNTGCRIRLSDGTTIASSQHRLTPGVSAVVRLELAAGEVVLSVDGHEECRAQMVILDGPRYCGLYGYYAGKRYKNLHIWQRGLPAQVPATAIGDAFLTQDPPDARHAAEQFARVVVSAPDAAQANKARVRQGLALLQDKQGVAADLVWSQITEQSLRDEAFAGGVMLSVRNENLAEAYQRWQVLTNRETRMAQAAWSSFVRASRFSHAPWAATDALLATGTDLPDTLLVREGRADLLLTRERWAAAIEVCHGIQPQLCIAQLMSGNAGVALADPSTPPSLIAQALLRRGQFADVEAMRPIYSSYCAQTLTYVGRASEILLVPWANTDLKKSALLALDKPQLALNADPSGSSVVTLRALVRLGRLNEALTRSPHNTELLVLAGQMNMAIASAKEGSEWRRIEVTLAVIKGTLPRAMLVPNELDDRDQLISSVIAPWLRALAGQADGREQLAVAAADVRDARAWRIAPLAQAVLSGVPPQGTVALYRIGDQALAKAMSADLVDQRSAAIAAWKAWLALSPAQRNPDDEPLLEVLARSRISAR